VIKSFFFFLDPLGSEDWACFLFEGFLKIGPAVETAIFFAVSLRGWDVLLSRPGQVSFGTSFLGGRSLERVFFFNTQDLRGGQGRALSKRYCLEGW